MQKLLFLFSVTALLSSCSNREVEVQAKERTITVTGSADASLCPDELTLTIQIGEYYTEQYDGKSNPKDYKTLVKLEDIEKPILEMLKKNGVADSNIKFTYLSTSWNWYSYEEKKPVHLEKTMTVKFRDFEKAVALVQQLDTKGISSLSLGDFHSSKEQQMRKDLKAEALKNAKEKAELMLSNIDHHIGDIVMVEELDDNTNNYWRWEQAQSTLSNSSYESSPSSAMGNPQDIKLRYSVKAEFEID
jgi:uncharacterized protein